MLSSTLSEVEIRNNNGWGTGDDSMLHLISDGAAFTAAIHALNSDGFTV
jgi:hypothetical protein